MLYKIWAYPLIDADEPRYAEAAKEMIDANQYLIPLADGLPRFDKPILFYWFEILSFKIFGINECAARLPSVIVGALTVSFVYWMGSFYRCGLAAALVLATSLEFFVISRMSITDSLLNFCIVATVVLYFLIKENHIHKNYIYLLSLCAALGFLTKGPIAILIPGMVAVLDTIIAFLRGDENPCIRLPLRLWLLAMTIFVFVAAPWYLAIDQATQGEFTHYFFVGQNLGRFSSTLSGHHQPWWFYIAVMIIGSMPWSLYLPALIADFKFKAENLRLQSFALVWLLTVVGFFSFSSTKLANYVMSIFAPIAILVALWLESKPSKKWVIINSSVYIVILLGLGFVYWQGYLDKLIASEAFVQNNLVQFGFIALIILGIFLSMIIAEIFPKLYSMPFKVSLCGLAIVMCIFTVDFGLIPFAHYKEAGIKNFLQVVPADTQIYLLTIDRPSVSFYSQSRFFPERVGMKFLKAHVVAGNKLCVIAKHDKAGRIASLKRLVVWSQDDIYLFVCSFAKKRAS